MKWMLTSLVLAAPRLALAACDHAHAAGECAHGGCGGGHVGIVLMAVVAALGYWVVQHSQKDSGAIRWGGRVVGWVLLVMGLLGFVCGSMSHMKGHKSKQQCPYSAQASVAAPAQPAAKTAATAPAKKPAAKPTR